MVARRLPLILAGVFCLLFLALPILRMFADLFADPEGFQLALIGELLSSANDWINLLYSLGLAVATSLLALVLGLGYAWVVLRTDLPGARWLAPLGILPLALPPIFIAMGYADLFAVSGFWPCVGMLGLAYAPLVAVMAARGLRAADGHAHEAAVLARGPRRAEWLLLRGIRPEILAGCLFVFVFVLSEHGVPEFLTIKGKAWHTYAEGVFARWTRRATGVSHADQVGPILASLPLLLLVGVALFWALRLRARTNLRGELAPLPRLRLRRSGWLLLLGPICYLGAGVVLPLVVMTRWAMGSTQLDTPMSLGVLRGNFQQAFELGGKDLQYSLWIGAVAALLCIAVALPLSHAVARGKTWIEHACVLPLGVPAILLGIGMVKVYNSPLAVDAVYPLTGDLYTSPLLVALAYAARFLPFALLPLIFVQRRQAQSLGDAATLAGRPAWLTWWRIDQPLLRPAIWTAFCLVFVLGLRELDLAVLLPAGNDTVVRRLSNIVHFGGEDMGGALALLLLGAAALVPLLGMLLSGRKLESLS